MVNDVKKQVSILIIGYDGYSDLWDDCIGLLFRFWPDCPYTIFFVNNKKDVSWEGVNVLHAGESAEWSEKVRIGLSHVNTSFVCLMLEDFLIGSPVATKMIDDLVEIMETDSIDYLKLVDLNNPKKDHCKQYKQYKFLHKIKACDDYGISLQAAIWRTSFLKEKLGNDNYNAWIFEFNRVKETSLDDKSYRNNALFDTRNVLNLKHGVMQGEYIPTTIDFFMKKEISLNVERKVMKRSKYRKIRFKSWCRNSITPRFRRSLKKTLEKVGFVFVSTKRDV